MLNDYAGIISLYENEDDIKSLTKNRPLGSIPFCGRYRIIDFILSNMVNSGINNVAILTKSNSRSLIDHVGSGKPWDLDRKLGGLFVFNFGFESSNFNDIEMLKNNIEYLYRTKEKNVILSSSYMICNINFEEAVKCHEKSGKDVTIIYKKINDEKKNFINCDVLNIDKNNNILSVGKNIGTEGILNISMEMYIMKKSVLLSILNKAIKTGYYKNLKEAINKNISNLSSNAYEFNGYLSCINSTNSYYKANMDMLNLDINKELFFNNGLIYTKIMDEAPTKYHKDSHVTNSLIANGCLIEGSVENSIISRRVTVHKNVSIKNSIILQNCEIKENAKLTNIIVDKNVTIEENKELKGDEEIPLVIEKKPLYMVKER